MNNNLLFYCINLENAEKRRETIERQSRQLGISIEFIPAIDGRITNLEHHPYKITNGIFDWKGYELSGAQIGCMLSHRKCLEKFLGTPAEFLVVLEDDAKFLDDCLAKIEFLTRIEGFDLIKLETRHSRLRGYKILSLRSGEILHVSTKGDIGTTAILYSRIGATKTLKSLETIKLPFDVHIAHYACWNLKTLDLHPPIICSDDREFSQIAENINGLEQHRIRSLKKAIGQGLWSLFRNIKAVIVFLIFRRI